jgi:hypothetical protein
VRKGALLRKAFEWGLAAKRQQAGGHVVEASIASARAELAAWHAARMPA